MRDEVLFEGRGKAKKSLKIGTFSVCTLLLQGHPLEVFFLQLFALAPFHEMFFLLVENWRKRQGDATGKLFS